MIKLNQLLPNSKNQQGTKMGCCPRPTPTPRWDSSLVTERRKKRFELLEQRLTEQAANEAILQAMENDDE